MGYYLDTSVLIAMILRDTHTAAALSWFTSLLPTPLISTFVKTEFSAVVSRQIRIQQQTVVQAQLALRALDKWSDGRAQIVTCTNGDVVSADMLVRDFATKVGAPDAIHLAIARRCGATLATFDNRLADAAKLHSVPVIIPR